MTQHRQRSIRDVLESKVTDVMGFKLEPFHERFVKGNRWLEIHTREGKGPDDEWIEIMGGTLGGCGKHFHQGFNKDMMNRFDRRKGEVHASRYLRQRADWGEAR
jgi:hypothetical protein